MPEIPENLDKKITCSHSHHCESFRHRKVSALEPGWISCPYWVWFDLFVGRTRQEILLGCFPAVIRSAELTEKRWSHRRHAQMQNSSFAKHSVQKWDSLHDAVHHDSQSPWIMPGTLPPANDALALLTVSRPTVRQKFGNKVICSTHNSLHLRPWDGGWRTMTLYQSLPSVLDACIDLIFCGCTKQCTRVSCKCRMSRLLLTIHSGIKCHDTYDTCYNGWSMMKCRLPGSYLHWRYLLTGC